jgi:hypothetical protein
MKFYDDFELYKLTHLSDNNIQNELNILVATIQEKNTDNIFYLDKEFLD